MRDIVCTICVVVSTCGYMCVEDCIHILTVDSKVLFPGHQILTALVGGSGPPAT